MDLHKKIIEKYQQYEIIFDDAHYLSIIYDSSILIRAKYMLLGSYSVSKNVWIWADSSPTLENKLADTIREFKKEISLGNIHHKLRDFIESKPIIHESSKILLNILPTSDVFDLVDEIGRIKNVNILYYKLSNNKIVFLIIEKIIYQNIF